MDERGERVLDDSFYVMFNAHQEPQEFALPEAKWGRRWTEILDTSESTDHLDEDEEGRILRADDRRIVAALVGRTSSPFGREALTIRSRLNLSLKLSETVLNRLSYCREGCGIR